MLRWLQRAALFIGVAVMALAVCAAPALAQIAPDGDVSPDTPAGSYLTINNTLVLILTGAVIPLLNGFFLRPENPGWVKVLVSSVFATIAHGFSQTIQDDGTAFLTQEWALGLALTIAAMIGTYIGIWKPTIDPNRTFPSVQDPLAPRR